MNFTDSGKIHEDAKIFREININFSHIDFILKNEVNVKILKAMHITKYLDDRNNEININDETSEKITIFYHNAINSSIKIQNIKVYEKLQIDIYGSCAKLVLKNNISIFNSKIQASTNGIVEIGKDCLIDQSVDFYQNDSHHIFDKVSGNCINNEMNIYIGNHVWINRESMLLGGTNIPDNCVVEARTVTRDSFIENNTIIGGQPGKIIRRNIIWARDEQILNYDSFERCNDKTAKKYF